MGKPTGFLEYQRLSQAYEPVPERIKSYKEFVLRLSDEQAAVQGARCMDCGIPFCNNGCPVNNIIPDWNDLVYRGQWQQAIEVLHSTNNFPEFTGRICPAPCEAACTLNINSDAVGIKSIEQAIIDKAWEQGWVKPQPAAAKTGKKIAVVGSGPAGMAAAQQLARAGHDVTVFEKNDRVGGLLRYGIPDFKMEKSLIDRRVEQMQAEGVTFRTGVVVGAKDMPAGIINDAKEVVTADQLKAEFDAVVLAGGSEVPRDLPVPGRELAGVHYALEFLIPQNKQVAGDRPNPISAEGCNVVVIGGGDTGSDCVGTSYRHGATSVTQFEVMPQPPEQENKALTWPYWPIKLRTSSSHLEGETQREYAIGTKEFIGENGKLTGVRTVRLEWKDGRMSEVAGSEQVFPAERVFLAMGFTNPVGGMLEAFGVDKDARGNAKATTDGEGCYATNVDKVFAAGDVRRGQSLVVWAIREGRQCARAVDEFLMGASVLPR
ncbi:glutamate synthase subunit beta [Parazoarcus communis]|uniref:Glutamate synthase n=1 Tax=Parazoarcus communis SWub3 = DSM 12120 TaxID=1121029 RepID=A0A323UR52_9RHOO|nr:glutamate synthase subunit beta [Parazoarcus communis]NMG71516.1 glutamate synthase small subunit [Parazoarcus communis SWub3 = DSM 12120]PZA15115.1 glutamate synthase [Azoarcus communis] [Parazoarcus communis SWub3 = DSM 12120]